MIERFYIDNDMSALKSTLSSLDFFDGYTISIDIDWSRITKEMPSASPYYYDGVAALENVEGAEDTVYVVKESDTVYRLYTYNSELGFSPSFTTSVTASGSSSSNKTLVLKPATISISDSDGHELFRLTKSWRNNGRTYIKYKTYIRGSNVERSIGSDSYEYGVNYAYSCKNGIILWLYSQSAASLPLRIVKTNNSKLAFITWGSNGAPSSGTPSYPFYQNIDCITYEDITPLVTYTFANRYDTHYVVVPLLTNSQAEVVSYTDKSGFLPYSTQDRVIKVITINGKKYLTDSYFAIEDE